MAYLGTQFGVARPFTALALTAQLFTSCIDQRSCAEERTCAVNESSDASTTTTVESTGSSTPDASAETPAVPATDVPWTRDAGITIPTPSYGVCGDGFVDPGEACDDGAAFNLGAYGGCTSECELAPFCGDGQVAPEEVCDIAADGGSSTDCPAGCGVEVSCGDGLRSADEACDLGAEGNDGTYGGCTAECELASFCGDGVVDSAGSDAGTAPGLPAESEECDPGNDGFDNSYGGCQSNCQRGPYCGDGEVNGAEECDQGADQNTGEFGGCQSDCTSAPLCNPAGGRPDECDAECVDLATDEDNCGDCGNQCQAGYGCDLGECQLGCPTQETACDNGYCANLATDEDNCGACGAECPNGFSCEGGTCVIECSADGTACDNNRCADLQNDENDCGACGNECDAGERCEDGECELDCAPGQETCGATCVDLSDPETCGSCESFQRCPEPSANGSATCNAGTCGTSCDAGFTVCGSECVDTSSTAEHCGGCDQACPPPVARAWGSPACRNSQCEVECDDGLSSCDYRWEESFFGREGLTCVDTSSDVEYCGGCTPCPDWPGVRASCEQSACSYVCDSAVEPLDCHSAENPACGYWDFVRRGEISFITSTDGLELSGQSGAQVTYNDDNVGSFQVDFVSDPGGVAQLEFDVCSDGSAADLSDRELFVRLWLDAPGYQTGDLEVWGVVQDGLGTETALGATTPVVRTTMMTYRKTIAANSTIKSIQLYFRLLGGGSGQISIASIELGSL